MAVAAVPTRHRYDTGKAQVLRSQCAYNGLVLLCDMQWSHVDNIRSTQQRYESLQVAVCAGCSQSLLDMLRF